MQMSNRISGFQTSPIRRLVPYSRAAEKNGVHVIHLNIGQPDIKTPKEALDAIHNYDQDIIAYGISEGDIELRRAMLDYYARFGITDLTSDDIMITTGDRRHFNLSFLLFVIHMMSSSYLSLTIQTLQHLQTLLW